MQIVSYNKFELQELIYSDFFEKLNKIPISKHRALSHINNPYCADDDILLWAVYRGETLLAYSSVLPDMIVRNGSEEKIYWSSSVWKEKSEEKNTLAAMLLLKMLEKYKSRFFITDFIPEAEKSYSKLRIFKPMETEFGCTFFRNLALSQTVERHFPKSKCVIRLYSFLEKCVNFALFLGRKPANRKAKSDFEIVENKVFDAEFDDFIENYCNENNLVVRNSVFFDWIVKYPWILQQKPDSESKRYHFSSASERFEYHSVKIYDKQKLAGFMFLKIRNKCLTVSFSYLNNACAKDAANYVWQMANSKNIDSIVAFDPKLVRELTKKRMKYIFAKKTAKKYFFPRSFEITSSAFQEGDGDMVFT